MRRAVVAVALAAVAAACSGKDNPASPSQRVPSYAGSWSGNYLIAGCQQSGGMALANLCSNVGSSLPYVLTLQQSGSSVTGSFTLGSVSFPSTGGTVGADGSLGLQATSRNNGIVIIVNWALHNSGNAVTGTITQNWTSDTLSGQVNITGTISTAVHGAETGGHVGISAVPANVDLKTLGELLKK